LEVPELNYGLGWNSGNVGFLDGADTLQASFYGNPFQDKFKWEDGKIYDSVYPKEEQLSGFK
jgi:hypothetical protein